MAEMFTVGTNRIAYQSSDFGIGVTVKASVYGPSATDWISGNNLTELSQGVYYLDFNFSSAGMYIVKFAENGEAMLASVYRIWDIDTDLDSVYNNSRYISSNTAIISSNIAFVKNVEGGRWLRSGTTLTLYKSDNVTSVASFTLKTSSNTAAGVTANVFERLRI